METSAGNVDFDADTLDAVPLFPLPNVVLFPRAILPLHIFEERYKAMTADAIQGNGLVAMALLCTGWEKTYYSRPAVEPVVCVGKIVSHERLADGKHNFLLEGQLRATIEREWQSGPADPGQLPYRTARVKPLALTSEFEIDLGSERDRMDRLFSAGPLARLPLARQFRKMISSPLATADIADLISFNILEDVALKYSLLAEGDVRRRVGRVLEAMSALTPPPMLYSGVDTLGGGDPHLN